MENKSKKKNVNYYKISTLVLVAVLVIVGGYFLYMSHVQNVASKNQALGQQQAADLILRNVAQKGQFTFQLTENKTLTLVTLNDARKVRENTILEIFNYVEEEGSVTLYNNETQMTLVPYQGDVNTQSETQSFNPAQMAQES